MIYISEKIVTQIQNFLRNANKNIDQYRQKKKVLEEMQIYYLQSLEMIKPKQAERRRKMIRTNDRHQTEWNYKRGF